MTNKTARLIPTALTLALALSGGCLEKETASTAYVEADGTVTWTILETGVRSDRTDPAEARQEENEYLAEHQGGGGRSRLAAALAAIGGRDVHARLLHATVPFEVHVSARFDSLDGLVGRYCAARGWRCASKTDSTGDETSWTWTVTVADTGDQAPGGDDTFDPLEEAVTGLRICLGAGRFVSASGFTLEGDRMARIAPDEHDAAPREYTFRLAWRR